MPATSAPNTPLHGQHSQFLYSVDLKACLMQVYKACNILCEDITDQLLIRPQL